MNEKTFETSCGIVHYWIDPAGHCKKPQLVFLPGLTANRILRFMNETKEPDKSGFVEGDI